MVSGALKGAWDGGAKDLLIGKLALTNPGVALFASFLAPFLESIFEGGDNAFEEWRDKVIEEVESLMRLESQQAATRKIQALREEMEMVPAFLSFEGNPSAEQDTSLRLSWWLMLQYEMSVLSTELMGACMTDVESQSCKDWGGDCNVLMLLPYAELHLSIFTVLQEIEPLHQASFVRQMQLRAKDYVVIGTKMWEYCKTYGDTGAWSANPTRAHKIQMQTQQHFQSLAAIYGKTLDFAPVYHAVMHTESKTCTESC